MLPLVFFVWCQLSHILEVISLCDDEVSDSILDMLFWIRKVTNKLRLDVIIWAILPKIGPKAKNRETDLSIRDKAFLPPFSVIVLKILNQLFYIFDIYQCFQLLNRMDIKII